MTPEEQIIAEIRGIIDAYNSGAETPGGLEHMGDVQKLFTRWERLLCPNAPSIYYENQESS